MSNQALGRSLTAGARKVSRRWEPTFAVFAVDLSNNWHTLTPDVEGLRFSTSSPGGYLSCTFTLNSHPKKARRNVGQNYILEVKYQGAAIWQGRIEDIGPRKSEGRWTEEITAMGMQSSLHDLPYSLVGNWANTASEQTPEDVIKYWLTTYCADISTDQTNIAATSATIATGVLAYPYGTDTATVVEDMIKFGYVDGSTYGEMNFAVWELDTSYEGVAYYEKRETTPSYYVRLQDLDELQFQATLEHYYNRINVLSNTVVTTVEDTTAQSDIGRNGGTFVRAYDVPGFDGMTLGVTAKTQIANRYLAYYKEKVLRAEPFAFPWNEVRVRNQYRARVDPWRVRAGQYLRIENLWPDGTVFGSGLNFERDVFIAETEYDVDEGTLTITPENPDDSLEREIARLQRDVKPKK